MSGFSMQDMLNLSNKSLAEGLAEGAALRDELAEALRGMVAGYGHDFSSGSVALSNACAVLAKYEASKS